MDLECQLNVLYAYLFQSSRGRVTSGIAVAYRVIKLLEHGMKVMERVLEKRLKNSDS